VSRVIDKGAIFAGWVGVGMSVMVVIGLELIVAVQTLALLFAPIGGLFIGSYANARSERRRPWGRVLSNSVYAGLVTGLTLAVLYTLVRLIFVYADSGYGGGPNGSQLQCRTGPDCTYQRYLQRGREPGEEQVLAELQGAGVVDAASFERYLLAGQARFALVLTGVTLLGAVGGGLLYAAASSGTASAKRDDPATIVT
jgi:hypothetical protein